MIILKDRVKKSYHCKENLFFFFLPFLSSAVWGTEAFDLFSDNFIDNIQVVCPVCVSLTDEVISPAGWGCHLRGDSET